MAPTARKRLALTLAVTLVVVVAAAALAVTALQRDDVEAGPQPTLPTFPSRSPTPEPDPCRGGADRAFVPETISIRGKDYSVLALQRDAQNVPGVPPLTPSGKWEFGWDVAPSPLPGSRQGHVLVNAHTYPDGSALGNRLFTQLPQGTILEVRGEGQVQCYRVERRFEVPADSRDSGYENDDGPRRLAILACSGDRSPSGDWSHRTIWFAKAVNATPSAPRAPRAPRAPSAPTAAPASS
ncbi:class F sortase [Aeromicrobium duanguangcaii]|uniref:Class F sortase n=1 Tax=Aeromicrobium duanguangcaii TaxID=2968086 RepID=A0ABY5KHN2_9ACTN|nr:class F sortase [Aeromicrobium duanguangcaii]MCD9153049.1 class F sortase [Aeromicrobium duanguangcaii]UUI69845.1 class F sortase [Aeromicrobium duanguangcaii]